MNNEDKEVVSVVRNSLGTTYILVGLVFYLFYYLFFQNSLIGLIILLSEPILFSLVFIKWKWLGRKEKRKKKNWQKGRNTTLAVLLLLTVFFAAQSPLSIILQIIAGTVVYLYLKP